MIGRIKPRLSRRKSDHRGHRGDVYSCDPDKIFDRINRIDRIKTFGPPPIL